MNEQHKILLAQIILGAFLSFILALLLQAVFFGFESLNVQLDIIKTALNILQGS